MTKIPIRSHGLSVRRSAVSLLLQLLIDFPGGEAERERERERERESRHMAPPLTLPPLLPPPSKQPKGSGSEREESLEHGPAALLQFAADATICSKCYNLHFCIANFLESQKATNIRLFLSCSLSY